MNDCRLTTHRHYLSAHLSSHPADYRAVLLLYKHVPHGPCDADIWAQETWSRQSNAKDEMALKIANVTAAFEFMCEEEGLSGVGIIYRELFFRTKAFVAEIAQLCCQSSENNTVHGDNRDSKSNSRSNRRNGKGGEEKIGGKWADAACLLIQWSISIFRHPRIHFDRFLLGQKQSLYWILDDALLRLCIAQWENNHPTLPWDIATAPLNDRLKQACKLVPEWADRDEEEYRRWGFQVIFSVREALEDMYFVRSRRFLRQSRRVHEVWRTMRMWGQGRLPVELAEVVVADVSFAEDLPVGELRGEFLPKDKDKIGREEGKNGGSV